MQTRKQTAFRLPRELLDRMDDTLDDLNTRGLEPGSRTALVIQAVWQYLPFLERKIANFDALPLGDGPVEPTKRIVTLDL